MSNPQPTESIPGGDSTVPGSTGQSSGPRVAELFHRGLGAVGTAAFLSLLAQIDVLLGSDGLRPVAELMARSSAQELSIWELPTLFWLSSSDAALTGAAILGTLLCVLSTAGLWPRACLPLAALIYQSYAAVGDAFLAFQWDSMLVELLLLAAFVPAHRPAPGAHLIMRLMLFKLYFESGIAKWQSHLGDWLDGSAMAFYYETAPLPAPLAWHAHQLPQWWHRGESWLALVLELLVPFLIFGPRRARLFAFFAFTGFQVVNTATANYGFFTYLSVVLHVFLLSDADLRFMGAPSAGRVEPGSVLGRSFARSAGHALRPLAVAWVIASLLGAAAHFGGSSLVSAARPIYRELSPLRVANVYHLFGHITRARIEPEFQTLQPGDGAAWTAHDLHYKPGDLGRAPPLVAPHQPRVDFRLWFYGLGHRRGLPPYVRSILEGMCRRPAAVQPLFADRLPAAPQAVRIQLFRYRFTNAEQRAQSGDLWRRTPERIVGPLRCD